MVTVSIETAAQTEARLRKVIRETSIEWLPGVSVLAAWLKTTARTIAAEGVTLNGVLPGRLSTPRIHELDSGRAEREGITEEAVRTAHIGTIPAGRYGHPEGLGALVAFLASERASYVTGQLVAVDGGLIAGL